MTCFQVIGTSGSGVKRISLSGRDGIESGAHIGVHPTLYTENFPVTPVPYRHARVPMAKCTEFLSILG